MPLVSTQVNSDGANHQAFGSRSGTRTAANFTISLGFRPSYVKVQNLTDGLSHEWTEGMNAGDFIETTFSTGAMTVQTDDKLTISDTGFSCVVDGGIETDNDLVVWEARG